MRDCFSKCTVGGKDRELIHGAKEWGRREGERETEQEHSEC